MKNKNLSFVIEKTRTGFSAYEERLAIFSTGKTLPLLLKNIEEAISLYNENASSLDLHFDVKFEHFFLHYGILNAKLLAERIGMNASLLSQYIRGTKKMSQEQALRIELGVQQIGKELAGIRFNEFPS